MAEDSAWEILSDAGQGQVILGIDFPSAGRIEAGFADLLDTIGPRWPEYGFLQTVAPRVRPDRLLSGDEYLRGWAEGIRQAGQPVAAVLGYCAGSVYASAIAEEVRQWQDSAPTVILFDPQADPGVLADEMYSEMYKMIDVFRPLLSAGQGDEAKKKTAELAASGSGDLYDTAAALVGLYQEAGSVAFAKLGLSDARRGEIVAMFESYLAWLCTTTKIGPSPGWRRSPAILSADYLALAGQNPAVGAASRTLSCAIPVEVSHTDLLRSEATAQKVLEQMKAGQPCNSR